MKNDERPKANLMNIVTFGPGRHRAGDGIARNAVTVQISDDSGMEVQCREDDSVGNVNLYLAIAGALNAAEIDGYDKRKVWENLMVFWGKDGPQRKD